MGGEGSGGHSESGALRVELENARVVVTCRNSKCQQPLVVGAPTHEISVTPSGVNVEPSFSCGSCGLVMRVHRDEVIATGWERRRQSGSSIVIMPDPDAAAVRPAVRIERPRAVEFVQPPAPEPEPEPAPTTEPEPEVMNEPEPEWYGVDIFTPLESPPEKKGRQDGRKPTK